VPAGFSLENALEEQTMIFDYSLAGLVSAGLLFYLTYALLAARTVLTGFPHRSRKPQGITIEDARHVPDRSCLTSATMTAPYRMIDPADGGHGGMPWGLRDLCGNPVRTVRAAQRR